MRLNPSDRLAKQHDKAAPYWAVAMLLLCLIGISTVWVKWGNFWNGYVLDITGPAWNYILFRRLSHAYQDNAWVRFFSPTRTLVLFLLVCFGIETAQYLELYEATFDPWDLLAYCSLLLPLYGIDRYRLHAAADSKKKATDVT